MKFELNTSGHQLFVGLRSLSKKEKLFEKQKRLIKYGKWLSNELGRNLIVTDFEKGRISAKTIQKIFGKFSNFITKCGLELNIRHSNMSISEFKLFLKNNREITTNTDCWISSKFKNNQITYKNKTESTYRVSYKIFKGEILKDQVIRHLCHNRDCYNPEHLVSGSQKENMKDSSTDGRLKITKKPSALKFKRNFKSLDKTSKIIEWVKSNCDITDKNEWLWTGSILSSGYAQIQIDKKYYKLHRLMLSLKLGKSYKDIESARHVLPDGSKPKKHDVNPDHLEDGSRSQNSIDSLKYSKSVKITPKTILEIKKLVKSQDFTIKGSRTAFDRETAQKFDISWAMVRDIRLNRRWSHITDL